VAERFRALVERSTVRSGEVEIGVTISIGAALARPGEAPESLLGRADAALYRAKADGRNRVRLDPEDVDAI
jgi:diguanylate cyclase (GGDEF)-like protein